MLASLKWAYRSEPIILYSACLFLLVIVFDLFTVCPTIYWRDAPEFVDVVQTLGIPHPAGSPTYLLIAKILTLLPLGNLALRVNMVSVLFHGLSACLLFTCATLLLQDLWQRKAVLKTTSPSPMTISAALTAVMAFAFSPSFWLIANAAEVYTMHAFFYLAVIWVSLLFYRTRDLRYFVAGGFLCGLACGVHATIIFYFPAYLYLFISSTPKKLRIRALTMAFLFFVAGFCTYFYLPIRSLANPPFDWGNPETLKQFFIHITDRKTKTSHFDYRMPFFLQTNFRHYLMIFYQEMGVFLPLAALPGIFIQFRRRPKIAIYFVLLFIGNLVFYLNWKTGDGFVPSNLVITLWSAIGLHWAFEKLQRLSARGKGMVRWERVAGMSLSLFVLYAIFLPTLSQRPVPFDYANKTDFYNAYDTAKSEYETIPYDTMAITTLFWFPFRYFQDVERDREDLSILMASDVILPYAFNPLTKARFPKIDIPAQVPEAPTWYELMPEFMKRLYEKIGIKPTFSQKVLWYEYMPELINLNISKRKIYYEPNFDLTKPVYRNLVPRQFLFEVVSGGRDRGLPKEIREEFINSMRSRFAREVYRGSFDHDINAQEYYMVFFLNCADYLILQGHPEEARVLLNAALKLKPNQGTAELYMAQVDMALGDTRAGVERLQKVIRREPGFAQPNIVLGRAFLQSGMLKEAEYYLSNAKKLAVSDIGASGNEMIELDFLWLELLWKQSRLVEAKAALAALKKVVFFKEDEKRLQTWSETLSNTHINAQESPNY